jgi:hypothetical protein
MLRKNKLECLYKQSTLALTYITHVQVVFATLYFL